MRRTNRLAPSACVRVALAALIALVSIASSRASDVVFEDRFVAGEASSGGETAVGDVDGDGDLDLVLAADGVAWFESSGTGSFPTRHAIDSLSAWQSLALVDLDRDGDLDVVASGGDVSWFENLGGGDFGVDGSNEQILRAGGGFAMSLAAADIDGDGDLDLVAPRFFQSEVVWMRNDGSATSPGPFAAPSSLGAVTSPREVRVADLDRDGDLDVLAGGADGTRWYENGDGVGTFDSEHSIAPAAGNAGIGLALADLDRDGDLDLARATCFGGTNGHGNLSWFENDGSTSFPTSHSVDEFELPPSFADGACPIWVDAADFDGDGDLDLVTAEYAFSHHWYENLDGAGTFSLARELPLPAPPGPADARLLQALAADLDGDGDADVVSLSEKDFDGELRWFRNRTIHRSALFDDVANVNSGGPFNDYTAIAAGDIDGDGLADLVTGSDSDEQGSWWPNLGNGTFGAAQDVLDADGIADVVVADLDGDGDLDVAAAANGSPAQIVWSVNPDGLGGFAGPTTDLVVGNLDDRFNAIEAADLDADGDLDLVYGGAVDNSGTLDPTLAVLFNTDGAGTFGAPAPVTIGAAVFSEILSLTLADVNGDGHLDIVAAGIDSGGTERALHTYTNDGAGTFTGSFGTLGGGAPATSVVAADVDRDGDIDLVVGGDGYVTLFRNPGSGFFIVGAPLTTDVQAPVALFAADLDNDGDVDLSSASGPRNEGAWYANLDGLGTFVHEQFFPDDSGIGDPRGVTAADFDRDGDLDLALTAYGDQRIFWFENRGGQYAISTADASNGVAYDGDLSPLLAIDVQLRGRPGDSVGRFAAIRLAFDGPGGPLSSAQANALIDWLHVYRDNGSGAYEPAADFLVASLANLTLTGGETTVILPGGDPNLLVAGPSKFWIVGQMTTNASQQTTVPFTVTHRPGSGTIVRHEGTTIALTREPAPDFDSEDITPENVLFVFNTGDDVDVNPGDGQCLGGSGCTLRAAVMEANALPGDDRIVLPQGTYVLSIAGSDDNASAGDLDITEDNATTTIVGAGAGVTIIDAAGIDRVFHVRNASRAVFEDLTVAGGANPSSGTFASGGGIFFDSARSGAIRRCEIRDNSAGAGGGLGVYGGIATVDVEDTTFHRNLSSGHGDAVENIAATLNLTRCTVSNHNDGDIGDAEYTIFNQSDGASRINIKDSTIADNEFGMLSISVGNKITLENTIVASLPNPYGIGELQGFEIESLGYNLIRVHQAGSLAFTPQSSDQIGTTGTPIEARLEPLGDYGGPTLTQAPRSDSPVIDKGHCATSFLDQRGVARPIDASFIANLDDGCDIGAFEAQPQQTEPRIELPMRWCGVRGAPSIEDPGILGEATTDDLLRKRHERASDNIYLPQAGIALRSAANLIVENYPILDDPACESGCAAVGPGAMGDVFVVPDKARFDEFQQLVASCREAWQSQDPKIQGITAVHINRFVDESGAPLELMGIGGRAEPGNAAEQAAAGRVMVVDHYYRSSAGGYPNPPNPADTIDRLLAHEVGHAMSLRHGDGLDNDGNGQVDDDDDKVSNKARLDGNNVMQYRAGTELTTGQVAQARGHLAATVSDVVVQPLIGSGANQAPIDEQSARVLDFGFRAIADLQSARVLDFQSARVLDFQSARVLDFQSARVLDFQSARVLDFQSARVLDFGMTFSGNLSTDTTVLHATTGSLPWPDAIRPRTKYFYYLDLDRDDATGAYPPSQVNPDDPPHKFPGTNNFQGGPSVTESVGVDLVVQVVLDADCPDMACEAFAEAKAFLWNGGLGAYELVYTETDPTITAKSVGLYVDNGGGDLTDYEEVPAAITIQPRIPNAILFAAGWGFTTHPVTGQPVPFPVEMEVATTIECSGSTLNDGSGDSVDCQCDDCASCPDYPGCVGSTGTPKIVAGTQILTDNGRTVLTFEPPELPLCAVSPELANPAQTVDAFITELPTDVVGQVEVTYGDDLLASVPSSSIAPDGSVGLSFALPAGASGVVKLSAGLTGYAPRATCYVTVTAAPQLPCADNDDDGACDAVDPDDDDDGVPDGSDDDPVNPLVCADADDDGCDDCSQGLNSPAGDGPDYDQDGTCDDSDPDDDDDGVPDETDGDPRNANGCGDVDGDRCDDCTNGSFDPLNDGPDSDEDGRCDYGAARCGDSIVDPGEDCDDGNLAAGDDCGGTCRYECGFGQWATGASASSEYSAGEWAAFQATGTPNVQGCSDDPKAWSPFEQGSEPEWLVVEFDHPVYASGLDVYESFAAGFVVRVDLRDLSGTWHDEVWTGVDETQCPGILVLRWNATPYLVTAARIHTQSPDYEEIDAVALVAECAECGDDVIEGPEVCDDGNAEAGDGCSANCRSDETCGNGIVDAGEACDDGNVESGDGCNASCSSDESCGNDFVDGDAGEVCDDGNTESGDGCSASCLSDETCGNGIVDLGEVCDDGNVESGDGCSADCASAEVCGNGIVDADEACDDGNVEAGDGCSETCAVEHGWYCSGAPSTCATECGDGIPVGNTPESIEFVWLEIYCGGGPAVQFTINGQTALDAVNTTPCACPAVPRSVTLTAPAVLALLHDGTNQFGLEFPGFWLSWAVAVIDYGTTTQEIVIFDAGNSGDAEERDPNCSELSSQIDTAVAAELEIGETCDDGNTDPGDGCSATCGTEPGWTCTDEPSECFTTCGDGILAGNEVCDDGNVSSDDACLADCTPASCGDGYVNAGIEACDDGNLDDDDGCDSNCTPTACGNGILTTGESCDDANLSADDGCSATCAVESGWSCDGQPSVCSTVCGDGILVAETPHSIEFVWLGTSCEGPGDITFTIDGQPALVAEGDSGTCNCTPGIHSVEVTDEAVLALLASGANDFGVSWPGGSRFLAWALVVIHVDDTTQEIVIWDAHPPGDAETRNPQVCNGALFGNVSESVEAFVDLGEACDDGDADAGDGCSEACQVEQGWSCSGEPSNCAPVCGDGLVVGDEACDDGNDDDTDACLPTCLEATCGDGFVHSGAEACDDGNATDDDGCDSNCTLTACGNGIQTDGEACDDGDATDGDGCDTNCTLTACGNGIATDGEACDDGNATNGDGCDTNCTATACGNGIQTDGEACDDGNATDGDGCDTNCTATACGNGIQTEGEACDDGNATDGDGCDTNCTTTACGNGIQTEGEACDDGNVTDGDGCDTNCTLTACGNGIVTAGEACDDGNATDGDGCDTNCTTTACGNGIVTAGEACDDGNATDGDGCDSNCVTTGCGNGIQTAGENCDDGNASNGDGCDNNCTATACGNGIATAGEACDDGNASNGDGCDTNCTATACGNGIATAGEACDDGNATNGDGCDANCTATACGNGIVTAGEACDDGNASNADACLTSCAQASCGDGFVRSGVEACDDGNANDGDACSNSCTVNGVSPNVVQNGDFEAGTAPWVLFSNASAGLSLANGEARVHITSSGTNVQLYQRNIALTGGVKYRLLLEARHTNGKAIQVRIHRHGSPYELFAPTQTLQLSTAPRQYELEFTITAGNKTDARVVFWLADTDDAGSSFYFDDVRLERVFATCGNGVVEAGEGCDDGASNSNTVPDACRTDCQPARCGDRVIDPGEACDDGDLQGGDGCDASCTIEDGYACTDQPSSCAAICGDGLIVDGEVCDGANLGGQSCATLGFSGGTLSCQSDCRSFDTSQCTAAPFCGNGVLDPGEECDSGAGNSNTTPNACRTDCRLARCGDGVVDGGEACDDGNGVSTDACSNVCTVNAPVEGIVKNGEFAAGSAPWAFYSNGSASFGVVAEEARVAITTQGTNVQLYQANIAVRGATAYRLRFRARNLQGLDMAVVLQKHGPGYNNYGLNQVVDLTPTMQEFVLHFSTTAGDKTDGRLMFWFGPYDQNGTTYFVDGVSVELDGATCGDGAVDAGEECDAGASNSNTAPDACRTNCRLPRCGDAVEDSSEGCDDGNTTAGDGCASCAVETGFECSGSPSSCQAICGDGQIVDGESCDGSNVPQSCVGLGFDGGTLACNVSCGFDTSGCFRNPYCGDGALNAGEECDAGAANSNTTPNACRTDCRLPRCGDAVQDTGETCDDGNLVDGDLCGNDCQLNAGPNVLANGDFGAGKPPWAFYSDGSAGYSVVAGEARIAITAQGGNVQLYQSGLALKGGRKYRVRFRGRNTAGTNVAVQLFKHGSPYTNYGLNREVDLTATMQEFSVDFTTTTGDKTDARFVLSMGPYDTNGASYFFDDVVLEELP